MSKPGAWLPSWAVGLVLQLLLCADPGWTRGAGHSPSLNPSARRGFLGECSRFDAIGLHVGTDAAVRSAGSGSDVAAQGRLRLSLTFGNLAEAGVAAQLDSADAGPGISVAPVSLFVRLRLLPLPLGPLGEGPLRLALTYQHELVTGLFGHDEPLGLSRGTLRLVAGRSYV